VSDSALAAHADLVVRVFLNGLAPRRPREGLPCPVETSGAEDAVDGVALAAATCELSPLTLVGPDLPPRRLPGFGQEDEASAHGTWWRHRMCATASAIGSIAADRWHDDQCALKISAAGSRHE
jgi:hypothetical protein